MWVHGGAWTTGNKTAYPAFLTQNGFAVASLDFRSSNDARFPANVHDIKAGIRFLRAKAKEYGYRADRIGIVGASSGGHLAALVGVTGGNKELEGSEGDYPKESSSVQAIVSYFGASDLTTILAQSTPAGLRGPGAGTRPPVRDVTGQGARARKAREPDLPRRSRRSAGVRAAWGSGRADARQPDARAEVGLRERR